MDEVLWSPDPATPTRMGAWMAEVTRTTGVDLPDYRAAWEWSVTDLDGFWRSVWDHLGLVGRGPDGPVLADDRMPGARWFEGWRLNYARNVLDHAPAHEAVVSHSQTRAPVTVDAAELRRAVGNLAAHLRHVGVGPGDRVAAYMPNIAESLIGLLACASIGAVWSACPPEFGVKGVVDRFAQIGPTVLLAVDGYRHRGRDIDRTAEVAEIVAQLPSLRALVAVGYLRPDWAPPGWARWADVASADGTSDLVFAELPFDHPLYILYSSGTTGLPKAIVHGHGGILVEHAKMLALHHDLGPGQRFFWFSTTGWMMWNYSVSALLTGASLVLFDGDPLWPDPHTLWELAATTGITSFGTSAAYLLECRRRALDPGAAFDLSAIREVGSTGSPLPADGFRWVYDHVGTDLRVASISGGTDVCTAFVAGSPLLPVTAGEIACRALGARVEAYDDGGRAVIGREGHLVVTAPMPSMPLGLWGDDDGRRYRAAYFEGFPGVWTHGDWITVTERGTCRVTGRSDSTLNRGGVRIGTGDFYSVVEGLDGVADTLVVHLEDPQGGPGELILFVQPAPGRTLDDSLRTSIVAELRRSLSPRHVPDAVVAVPSVPRTLSGKKMEVPVKRILTGTPPDVAASRDALADRSALDFYVALAAQRLTS